MPHDGSVAFINVTKRYDGSDAVKDVSLDIESGEFLTLLGPSGCGKTTLLRMLAGFESISSGEIRIAGKTMNVVPPYKRPIGMVFQNLALFPHLSVAQNIAFGLKVQKEKGDAVRKKVDKTLELVGLPGYGDRRIAQLSGGQQQRVALGRSLVLEPSVLLLDEPFSALDLKLRRQMQVELKQIQRQVGTTFVFVTHDQEEALTMSDRIAVMKNGSVEQIDTAENIYARPKTKFVADFVGETNFMQASVIAHATNCLRVSLDDCNVEFDMPLGAFEAFQGKGAYPSVGTRLAVCVRPEAIVLGDSASLLPVNFEVAVTNRQFTGASARYDAAAGTQKFIARLPSSMTPIRVSDRERMGFSPEAVVALETAENC
ncbi:hypothetical protein ASG35_12395 [Burkholderia sp. Leaf177]|nr:hypothetical protein ASG35_12395 [Burkholderia sp. Leaf177]